LLLSVGWLFFVNGSYLALLRSFADGSATSRHIDSCETFSLGSSGSRFFPPASAGPTLLPDSGSGSDSYIDTCNGVSCTPHRNTGEVTLFRFIIGRNERTLSACHANRPLETSSFLPLSSGKNWWYSWSVEIFAVTCKKPSGSTLGRIDVSFAKSDQPCDFLSLVNL
jgi:hypothetical protein